MPLADIVVQCWDEQAPLPPLTCPLTEPDVQAAANALAAAMLNEYEDDGPIDPDSGRPFNFELLQQLVAATTLWRKAFVTEFGLQIRRLDALHEQKLAELKDDKSDDAVATLAELQAPVLLAYNIIAKVYAYTTIIDNIDKPKPDALFAILKKLIDKPRWTQGELTCLVDIMILLAGDFLTVPALASKKPQVDSILRSLAAHINDPKSPMLEESKNDFLDLLLDLAVRSEDLFTFQKYKDPNAVPPAALATSQPVGDLASIPEGTGVSLLSRIGHLPSAGATATASAAPTTTTATTTTAPAAASTTATAAPKLAYANFAEFKPSPANQAQIFVTPRKVSDVFKKPEPAAQDWNEFVDPTTAGYDAQLQSAAGFVQYHIPAGAEFGPDDADFDEDDEAALDQFEDELDGFYPGPPY
eukprot:m.636856 g.636856  ORF g.636856 m.636856 type:complete len:415 (-) comp58313_c0_seq6:145-1389(-)